MIYERDVCSVWASVLLSMRSSLVGVGLLAMMGFAQSLCVTPLVGVMLQVNRTGLSWPGHGYPYPWPSWVLSAWVCSQDRVIEQPSGLV